MVVRNILHLEARELCGCVPPLCIGHVIHQNTAMAPGGACSCDAREPGGGSFGAVPGAARTTFWAAALSFRHSVYGRVRDSQERDRFGVPRGAGRATVDEVRRDHDGLWSSSSRPKSGHSHVGRPVVCIRGVLSRCAPRPARVRKSPSQAMPFGYMNDVLARLDHLCIGRTRSCLGQLGGEMVKSGGVSSL